MCDKPRCVLKRVQKEMEEQIAGYVSVGYALYPETPLVRWASDLSTVLEQSYVDKIPERTETQSK